VPSARSCSTMARRKFDDGAEGVLFLSLLIEKGFEMIRLQHFTVSMGELGRPAAFYRIILL
jgi:hypothetical protein